LLVTAAPCFLARQLWALRAESPCWLCWPGTSVCSGSKRRIRSSAVVCLGLVFSGGAVFSGRSWPLVCLVTPGVVRVVPWLRGDSHMGSLRNLSTQQSASSAYARMAPRSGLASQSGTVLLQPNIADIVKAFVPALPLGLLEFAGGLLLFDGQRSASKRRRLSRCDLCTRWIATRARIRGSSASKPSPSAQSISREVFPRGLLRRGPRLYLWVRSWESFATRWRHVRSMDSARFHRRRDRGNHPLPGAALTGRCSEPLAAPRFQLSMTSTFNPQPRSLSPAVADLVSR